MLHVLKVSMSVRIDEEFYIFIEQPLIESRFVIHLLPEKYAWVALWS